MRKGSSLPLNGADGVTEARAGVLAAVALLRLMASTRASPAGGLGASPAAPSPGDPAARSAGGEASSSGPWWVCRAAASDLGRRGPRRPAPAVAGAASAGAGRVWTADVDRPTRPRLSTLGLASGLRDAVFRPPSLPAGARSAEDDRRGRRCSPRGPLDSRLGFRACAAALDGREARRTPGGDIGPGDAGAGAAGVASADRRRRTTRTAAPSFAGLRGIWDKVPAEGLGASPGARLAGAWRFFGDGRREARVPPAPETDGTAPRGGPMPAANRNPRLTDWSPPHPSALPAAGSGSADDASTLARVLGTGAGGPAADPLDHRAADTSSANEAGTASDPSTARSEGPLSVVCGVSWRRSCAWTPVQDGNEGLTGKSCCCVSSGVVGRGGGGTAGSEARSPATSCPAGSPSPAQLSPSVARCHRDSVLAELDGTSWAPSGSDMRLAGPSTVSASRLADASARLPSGCSGGCDLAALAGLCAAGPLSDDRERAALPPVIASFQAGGGPFRRLANSSLTRSKSESLGGSTMTPKLGVLIVPVPRK